MFGYINVYKDEMKIKDYDIYRAYYCGLCKKIGKNHNQVVRLSLSYDLTFLAILLDSLEDDKLHITKSGCVKKLGKRKIVSYAKGLDYSSDMNTILAYYNLKDDISDNHSLKAMFAIIPFLRRASAIRKRYPELCNRIDVCLKRLSFLEENRCDCVDKAANEFAEIMKAVFSNAKEELSDFGYQMGRLIYIMDAYDDMAEDFLDGKYNPAVLQYFYKGEVTEQIRECMNNNLYISMAELSRLYEKLDIKKNKEILDNIIYLGIRARCDSILRKENKNEQKSL